MTDTPLRFHQKIFRACERYLGIHCYRIRLRPLDVTAPVVRPEHLDVRQATETELWSATANPELGISREFLADAIARGDKSYAAFDDGQIVAFTWRSTNAAPHQDGLRVSASRPYIYGYKGFTLVSHRGMRLNIIVNDAANADSLQQGFTHMMGFVALHNAAKLANWRKHGFRTVGYAGYLRWFGSPVPFRTPSVSRTGFRFFRGE